MKKQKRGGTGLWILIAIIIIVLGIGAYFLLTGDSSIIGGSSIPSPPPLPN